MSSVLVICDRTLLRDCEGIMIEIIALLGVLGMICAAVLVMPIVVFSLLYKVFDWLERL